VDPDEQGKSKDENLGRLEAMQKERERVLRVRRKAR